jgi:cell division protein FtsN
LIILLVLVAGAALTFYLVYEGSIANLPFNVPGVAEPQTATEDAAPMPADTTANVLPLSPDTADSAVATDTTVGPAGLDRTAGGWTIIVGAYPTRPEADSMLAVFRQRLDDATAPVDTLTATDATRFRFRIAVGQYDTQTEAVSARQTLGEQLPADAWILRLQ